MMGERLVMQESLFYEFRLDDAVPDASDVGTDPTGSLSGRVKCRVSMLSLCSNQ